jgi:hypothetical protein
MYKMCRGATGYVMCRARTEKGFWLLLSIITKSKKGKYRQNYISPIFKGRSQQPLNASGLCYELTVCCLLESNRIIDRVYVVVDALSLRNGLTTAIRSIAAFSVDTYEHCTTAVSNKGANNHRQERSGHTVRVIVREDIP